MRTANALTAVHTLLKPYKYFQNPGEAKEAAPPELEAIVKALLEPLLGMLGVLAGGTLQAAAADAAAAHGAAGPTSERTTSERTSEKAFADTDANTKQRETDALLLVLLKCFHHTVAAYMPTALVPSLRHWLEVLVKILERAPTFFARVDRDESVFVTPRRKAAKRAIQCLISLVTRHRRHVDKALPTLCSHATALAGALAARRASAGADDEPCPTASRTAAACFDLLARVAETAPGFKLLAPNFSRLLEQAIFPALRAAADDERDWEEDEEEYLRRNLPADAVDDVTGFNEELYAPRQSAANLLALLAERGSGGGAGALGGDDDKTMSAQDKRSRSSKKGSSRASKRGSKNDTPGDVALSFLERFPPPEPELARLDGNGASNYYGVLVAYGALANWLAKHKTRDAASRGALATLIRRRVLPALAPAGANSEVASAMLRANGCWSVGELAATDAVPASEAHAALLSCLTDPAGAEHPALRSAAASAIAAALHASVWPEDWTPLLTAAAAAAAPAAAARTTPTRLGSARSGSSPSPRRRLPSTAARPPRRRRSPRRLARAAAGGAPAPPTTFRLSWRRRSRRSSRWLTPPRRLRRGRGGESFREFVFEASAAARGGARAALLRRAAARVASLRVGSGGLARVLGGLGGYRHDDRRRRRRRRFESLRRYARAVLHGGLLASSLEGSEVVPRRGERARDRTRGTGGGARRAAGGVGRAGRGRGRVGDGGHRRRRRRVHARRFALGGGERGVPPVRQVRGGRHRHRPGRRRVRARVPRVARRARPRLEARAHRGARGRRRHRRGGHLAPLQPREPGRAAGASAGARRGGVRRAHRRNVAAGREPGRDRGLGARRLTRARARRRRLRRLGTESGGDGGAPRARGRRCGGLGSARGPRGVRSARGDRPARHRRRGGHGQGGRGRR